jgi:hypothetical protein
VNFAGCPANTPVWVDVAVKERVELIFAEAIERPLLGFAPPGVQSRITVGMLMFCRLVPPPVTLYVRPKFCHVWPE